ncbi:MAG: VCBS repeat-containing protein [Lysobacterales bacterium]
MPMARMMDINGNGKTELFFFKHSTSQFWTWFLDGATDTGKAMSTVSGSLSVIDRADFDGDGHSELLMEDSALNLFVAKSSNGTSFNSITALPFAIRRATFRLPSPTSTATASRTSCWQPGARGRSRCGTWTEARARPTTATPCPPA